MPRTKIIATYGPSIKDDKVLAKVLKYADVVRLNFSHAPEEKLAAAERIREVSKKIRKEVSILADLPGPKIRIGTLDAPVEIKPGQRVVFCPAPRAKPGEIPIEVDIYKDMQVGSEVSIGDGNPKLTIKRLSKGKIICEALQDGRIESRKGINVKGSTMSAAPPTAEDIRLAKLAKKNEMDFIALSFVKSAADIAKMRKYVGSLPIISKIERAEAIENIEEITAASDAIMIARGDMALNVEMYHVPMIQDRIISVCRKLQKPVIVATQMLESMTRNQSPTRAEMTDVANAVKAGVDCLMLSDETAIGSYPVDAVKVLSDIASYTEEKMSNPFVQPASSPDGHTGIAMAAASISFTCKIQYIFIPTTTGSTARMISALRPESTIVALSNDQRLRRSFALNYGLRAAAMEKYKGDTEMVAGISAYARKLRAKTYMIVYGHMARSSSTNDTIRCFWER